MNNSFGVFASHFLVVFEHSINRKNNIVTQMDDSVNETSCVPNGFWLLGNGEYRNMSGVGMDARKYQV
jgi:hypothetical protein